MVVGLGTGEGEGSDGVYGDLAGDLIYRYILLLDIDIYIYI